MPVERPVGGEELIVHEARGKKLTVESQAKIEGRRGQNWTNSEVESLIALRGEMHEEFERNKQKQGMFYLFPSVRLAIIGVLEQHGWFVWWCGVSPILTSSSFLYRV